MHLVVPTVSNTKVFGDRNGINLNDIAQAIKIIIPDTTIGELLDNACST
jgi:hypothetical protein